jgi:hypothetical protein
MSIRGKVIDGAGYANVRGFILREPEFKQVSEKLATLSFAINSSTKVPNYIPKSGLIDAFGDKVPDGGRNGYYSDAIVNVELKFDALDAWNGKLGKGDLVEVSGAISERIYQKKDGTQGRSLEFSYIKEVLKKDDAGNFVGADAFGAFDDTPW